MSLPIPDYELVAIDARRRSPRTSKASLRADVCALRIEVDRLRAKVKRLVTMVRLEEAACMEPGVDE